MIILFAICIQISLRKKKQHSNQKHQQIITRSTLAKSSAVFQSPNDVKWQNGRAGRREGQASLFLNAGLQGGFQF